MVVVSQTQQTMSSFDSSDDEQDEVDVSPLSLDWLDLSCVGCAEPLGISSLPGCRFKDTWRSLSSDIVSLKAEGIKEVFVLCTRGELNKYRVSRLLQEYSSADMVVHHHPFPDGSVPSIVSLMKMLEEIRVNIVQGRKTLVHCYGGLGRSCLVAVSLLMLMDPELEPEAAIQKVQELRGPGAIQSVKQYNFIHDFRKSLEEFEKSREGTARSVSR